MPWYLGIVQGVSSIPFGSPGWRYLNIGRTDATDYSHPGLDDSGWSIGSCAFGSDNNTGHDYDAWGGYKTYIPLDTSIWLRRHISGLGAATVRARLDNYADIYWNGTKIAAWSHVAGHEEDYNNPYSVAVPANLITADNVLAVHTADDPPSSADKILIDVEVTWTG